MICNKDCAHCIHPDCVNDEMYAEDYLESHKRDKQLVGKRGVKRDRRSYYTENRERIIERNKEYYRSHKETCLQYHRSYRARTREKRLARQREYDRRRWLESKFRGSPKPPIDRASTALIYARAKRGISQTQLAKAVGYTPSTVSNYECGKIKKPDYEPFLPILPELRHLMKRDCKNYCDRADKCDFTDCYYRHLCLKAKNRNTPQESVCG